MQQMRVTQRKAIVGGFRGHPVQRRTRQYRNTLRASTRRRVQITRNARPERATEKTGLSPLPRRDRRAPVRIRISASVCCELFRATRRHLFSESSTATKRGGRQQSAATRSSSQLAAAGI
ncbi:uncharacterized protein LOC118647289 [Monomorium pharaonis]|uniref:uncharacterized protein LOC118647289 n=1 Tax=Monomorium pharaonis TaxID=307658 RepID=UPI0017468B0C|nr:uncharacterized protein LOC118647289 [Monomorium pharaonis]